ncbi:hypothetical protein FJY71_04585 [candidate division WOR-3 bacterium]|nr:hypothetical protein [candidate division WOR-3 bacterium]
MNQLLTAALCTCLLVSPAAAGGSGGMGVFEASAAMPDFEALNASLARYGGGELGTPHFMLGGAGYGIVDNVLVGGSGWAGDQSVSCESLNLRCRASVSGGAFEAGYAVLNLRHLAVIPALGIGGSGYDITLEPLQGDLINFDSLLLHPGRRSVVSFSRFTLTPELIIHVPISWLGFYVKAGYALSLGGPEWELENGGKLLTGPAVSAGMPFAKLGITFGGFSRPPRKKSAPAPTDDDDSPGPDDD